MTIRVTTNETLKHGIEVETEYRIYPNRKTATKTVNVKTEPDYPGDTSTCEALSKQVELSELPPDVKADVKSELAGNVKKARSRKQTAMEALNE